MNSVIQPGDIDTSRHFWDTFNNLETEVSARWIVKFCQQRDKGWKPFTYDEIEQFYQENGYRNFWFNRLTQNGFIKEQDNLYHYNWRHQPCSPALPKSQ
jgi:hypothetical protein